MTANELFTVIKKSNIKVAHICFAKEQQTPYICYLETDTNSIVADGIIVNQIQHYDVELYHDKSDMDCEIALETQFKKAGITYEKTTEWIENLKVLETIYTIGG